MSTGRIIDEELTKLNMACGVLGTMVVKRKIWRANLAEVATTLEESAKVIRSVLSETKS